MNKVAHVLEKNLLIIAFEAVQFHHVAAGVETEQVCNLFAQRNHHVRVWSNWRQNKFELEEKISMQLRSKLTVVRNIRIHHHSLLNAKRKMQLFSV